MKLRVRRIETVEDEYQFTLKELAEYLNSLSDNISAEYADICDLDDNELVDRIEIYYEDLVHLNLIATIYGDYQIELNDGDTSWSYYEDDNEYLEGCILDQNGYDGISSDIKYPNFNKPNSEVTVEEMAKYIFSKILNNYILLFNTLNKKIRAADIVLSKLSSRIENGIQ